MNNNSGGSSSASPSSRCQDCGNQAKRDCQHLRCRTCCKGRGFQCLTHVKSTWVPVSRRRPRHPQISSAAAVQQQLLGSNPKRHRETPDLGSGEGNNNFPAEMSFPAMFRCVRVSSADNVVDQYAYQTSVSIGGHMFAGILYDQGPADEPEGTGGSSSAAGLCPHPNHNFLSSRTTATPAVGTIPSSQPVSPFWAFANTSSHLFHFPKS